jgi:hypothetical protein
MNLDITQSQRKPPWIDVTRSNSETKQMFHAAEGVGIRNFYGLECAPNLSAEQKDASDWNSIGTSKSQLFEPSKSNEASKSNGSEKLNSSSSSSSSSNNNSNRSSMIFPHGISVPVEVRLNESAKAMSIAHDSDTIYTPQRIQEIIPELDIGHEENSMRGPSVIISHLRSCEPSPITEKGLSVVEFLFFYMTISIMLNIKLNNNHSIIHNFSDVI